MKQAKWFWGAFFILAAVFVVASQLTDFVTIGFWSILGTILLLAVVVHSIPPRNFLALFLSLVLLYEIYWQPLGLVHISFWVLILAAVLAGIGFSYLFRKRPLKHWGKFEKANWKAGEGYQQVCAGIDGENIDGENVFAKVSFGDSTKYLHSTALKTGQFYASFGSLEVYLDQVMLSDQGAEIYVDCKFGSMELYVPKTWRVKGDVRTIFAAADISEMPDVQPDAPLLTIVGNVSFGAVEVNYV